MLNIVNSQPPLIHIPFTSFTLGIVEEVSQIIISSLNTFCDLDPLLTVLLKACIDTIS